MQSCVFTYSFAFVSLFIRYFHIWLNDDVLMLRAISLKILTSNRHWELMGTAGIRSPIEFKNWMKERKRKTRNFEIEMYTQSNCSNVGTICVIYQNDFSSVNLRHSVVMSKNRNGTFFACFQMHTISNP